MALSTVIEGASYALNERSGYNTQTKKLYLMDVSRAVSRATVMRIRLKRGMEIPGV